MDSPDPERRNVYGNPCPSEECSACTNEGCFLCGAGLWNHDPNRNCQHDLLDRHRDGFAEQAKARALKDDQEDKA